MSHTTTKPDFLSSEIENVFLNAGNDFNSRHAIEMKDQAHLFEHQSSKMRGDSRRATLAGVLNAYLKSIEWVQVDFRSNMWAFRVNDEWFIRIIKLDSLEKDTPPKQSKTIRKAIRKVLQEEDHPTQLQLIGDGFENDSEVKLGKLKQGIACYHVLP